MEVLRSFRFAGQDYEVVNDRRDYHNELYVTSNKANMGGLHLSFSDALLPVLKIHGMTLDYCAKYVEDTFILGKYLEIEKTAKS